MARFNPPPTWPTPPTGWQPPRGWAPDASWPDAPAGWELWLDDDAERRVRRGAHRSTAGTPRRRLAAAVGVGLAGLSAAALLWSPTATAHRTSLPASAEVTGSTTVATAAPSPVAPSPSPSSSTSVLSLDLACPSRTASAPLSASFAHTTTADGHYTVAISYGDGRSYRGSDADPTAVFSHTYRRPGSYTVTAVLTDSRGQSATSRCSFRWSPPAARAVSAAGQAPAATTGSTPAVQDETTSATSTVQTAGTGVSAAPDGAAATPSATG